MKKEKYKYKKIIFYIILGILLSGSLVYASNILSSNITFDNTNTSLTSTNVQSAIDELNEKSKDVVCPKKYVCYKQKETLALGDYVKMTPTLASYTTDTTYTGYTSTQTINPQELNLWRVLKANSDGTIELISAYVSTTEVYFSGKTGYQNLVGYLNVLASKYENSKYTIGSRHVGYNDQTEYITDTTALDSTTAPWTVSTSSTSNTVESQGGGDMLYQEDYNLMQEVLGTRVANKVNSKSGSEYWLASRHYSYSSATYWYYKGRYLSTSGSLYTNNLYNYFGGTFNTNSICYSLRPIVIVKSGISYEPALGTSDDPFVLE